MTIYPLKLKDTLDRYVVLALDHKTPFFIRKDAAEIAAAIERRALAQASAAMVRGRSKEAQALQGLASAGFAGPQLERIWDRLVRAYVRP